MTKGTFGLIFLIRLCDRNLSIAPMMFSLIGDHVRRTNRCQETWFFFFEFRHLGVNHDTAIRTW